MQFKRCVRPAEMLPFQQGDSLGPKKSSHVVFLAIFALPCTSLPVPFSRYTPRDKIRSSDNCSCYFSTLSARDIPT